VSSQEGYGYEMKIRIVELFAVNLVLTLLYFMQGSFIVHPRYVRYEGKQIGFAMTLLGPPCGVSFGKTQVLLHYKSRIHKDFDLAFHGGYVSFVYMRE